MKDIISLKTKKRIIIIVIIGSLIMGYITFLISNAISYFLTKKISAKKEGEESLIKSVRLKLTKRYYLHLHHWLISSLAMILVVEKEIFSGLWQQIVIGFLSGIIWQGIYCYRDWYKIFYSS